MKKLILVLILCLPKWLPAQEIFLYEDKLTTRDIAANALITKVSSSFDNAIDNYKSYVIEEYNLKVKKENNTTYQIEEVDLPKLSLKRGDLKTYLIHTDSANIMAFSFQLGYDIFLTSEDHPDEMGEFRDYVIKYLDYHYDKFYQTKIGNLTKELDKDRKVLQQNETKINGIKKKVLSIDKKLTKEKDQVKRIELISEKQLIENEINELVNTLPKQREKIEDSEQGITEVKEEYQQYYKSINNLNNPKDSINQELK